MATNLGLAWPQDKWVKHPGRVVVEFLPAIEPGLDKATFMDTLEEMIETRSRQLAQEGLAQPRYARHYGHLNTGEWA